MASLCSGVSCAELLVKQLALYSQCVAINQTPVREILLKSVVRGWQLFESRLTLTCN